MMTVVVAVVMCCSMGWGVNVDADMLESVSHGNSVECAAFNDSVW